MVRAFLAALLALGLADLSYAQCSGGGGGGGPSGPGMGRGYGHGHGGMGGYGQGGMMGYGPGAMGSGMMGGGMMRGSGMGGGMGSGMMGGGTRHAAQQARSNASQQTSTANEVSTEGTVDTVAGNKIRMTTSGNQPIVVNMQGGKTEVHVAGAASADCLKPGVYVQFQATVNKDGRVDGTIDQITIYSPSYGKSPNAATTKARPRDPGIPFDNGQARGRAAKAGSVAAGDSLTSKSQLPGLVTVRGPIRAMHGSDIVVSAGSGLSVKGTLADTPQIDVNVADYSLASKGDRITVKGRQMYGALMADSVQIEVTDTISGKKRSRTEAAQVVKAAN